MSIAGLRRNKDTNKHSCSRGSRHGGILINLVVAYGKRASLTQALLDKTIKLACLDVYQSEPNIPAPWRELDNVILLPHIGSAISRHEEKMGELVLQNVEEFILHEQLITEVMH